MPTADPSPSGSCPCPRRLVSEGKAQRGGEESTGLGQDGAGAEAQAAGPCGALRDVKPAERNWQSSPRPGASLCLRVI